MVSLGGLVMPVAVMVAALVMEAVQKRIHPYTLDDDVPRL